jgi:hypothetical protein
MSMVSGSGPRRRSTRAAAAERRRTAHRHQTLRSGPATSILDLPIRGYESLSPPEIVVRLRGLTQSDLARIRDYERSHEGRGAILEAIEARQVALPLPEYDDLTVDELAPRLERLSTHDLRVLHSYERDTKLRSVVLDRIESLLG